MIDRRRFLGGAAALGLGSPRVLSGQESKPPLAADPQVVRVLEEARGDGRRLPGMIGAIVRGDNLAAIGAVGLRKVGSPEPMKVEDKVHLGSCTKAITATMIGTLVDAGKLRWDSTLGEVFPDRAARMHPGYRAVTLMQMLNHRAGLPADVPTDDLDPGASPTEQRRSLLGRMLGEAPGSRPGTAFLYSNLGYTLAGLMAEQASRTPWDRLIRGRVFEPLGMASAGFGPPATPGRVDQPWGHEIDGEKTRAVHADNPPVLGPAGTVHCSVPDWARFASLHLDGKFGEVRLVTPATLRALQTPPAGGDYAAGWLVCDRSWAGGTALNHAGSNTFWYCAIWLAPARNFGILLATNAAGDAAEAGIEQAIGGLIRYEAIGRRGRKR